MITGGASGIGKSIAQLFHNHGAKLIILDIQEDLGHQLCDTLGGTAIFFHGDVSIEADVSRAIDLAIENFGQLDIMVNNAGITGPPTPDIRQVSLANFKRVLDVNLCGVFLGTKHAARVMIPRGRGSIVAIASVCSVAGGLGPHAYTASKHGILGMVRETAAELGMYGIRVNCVSPYAVATSLALPHHLLEDDNGAKEMIVSEFTRNAESLANLKGVTLTTEDVAEAVLYLTGDEAKYVSGHNLIVDGGFTAVNHAFRLYR